MSQCLPQHTRVVAAAQTTIGGQYEQNAFLFFRPAFQKWMRELQVRATKVTHDLGNFPSVRRGFRSAIHRFLKTTGGDQLHRARDLADVAHRFQPFDK